ncbi:MAG TPA: nitrile hydratase subunit beta [Burkholderiales bacterium]|nr:nitrile hydratase subunit beta [Burkholderiales bacterium]
MNGVHDMGGMHGFGKVVPEHNEPVFHAEWEGRVLALTRVVLFSRAWNIDVFRHSQERVPPQVYLSVSYYHRWLLGITQSALEYGLIGRDELAAGHALHPAKPVERTMKPKEIEAAFLRSPFGRTPPREARFKPGDLVRTKNIHPLGHTRLPRYARGKQGRIEALHGCHVFPDSKAAGKGEDPQWLYTVVFSGRELWGEQADPSLDVSVDAFEPYLEAV